MWHGLLALLLAASQRGFKDGYHNSTNATNGAAFAAELARCPTSVHMHHLGVCRCECVFVDVGLTRWLHTPLLASPGLNLNQDDCRHPSPRQACVPGLRWHLRQKPETRARLTKALSRQRQSQRVLLYGFEANSHFTPQLEVLERRQRRNGYRVKLFTSTAIATHDGAIRLAVDQSVGHLGSGIEACHAEHASLPATPAASSAAAMVRAVDAAASLQA